jgi:hypothetical protein
VPAMVTYWRGTKRVQGAARLASKDPVNGWLALVLYLVLGPGFWAYLQVSLNDIWRAEADPLPGQSLPPAPADSMPEKLAQEPQPAQPPPAQPPPGGSSPGEQPGPGQQPPS